jgi:hypothetical protein
MKNGRGVLHTPQDQHGRNTQRTIRFWYQQEEVKVIVDSEDGKRHKPKLVAKEMLLVERRFILNHTHTHTNDRKTHYPQEMYHRVPRHAMKQQLSSHHFNNGTRITIPLRT